MTAPPIDPNILQIVDGQLRLLGSRCAGCGETDFPRTTTCRCCGGDRLDTAWLGDAGVLWSWTVQRFPPPSPPYVPTGAEFAPFGLGYVELPGEVIVEALLTESDPSVLEIGLSMRLTGIEVLTESGDTVTTFGFAPAEGR